MNLLCRVHLHDWRLQLRHYWSGGHTTSYWVCRRCHSTMTHRGNWTA